MVDTIATMHSVPLNDAIYPLTTEESLTDNPELVEELKEMNRVDPMDDTVPTAVIVDQQEPNILSSLNDVRSEPTAVLSDSDDELHRITESNKFIPMEETKPQQHDLTSLRSQSRAVRRELLVMADNPETIKGPDRIVVRSHYGAGAKGKLPNDLKPKKRKSREYLVACDFSSESYHAVEWTLGTMMRDGDKLHVVTCLNRDDNPDIVKEAGLSLAKELGQASDLVTKETTKNLEKMLLFDIQVITYAICGKVKDVLFKLISDLPLTMVICGSRGRGTMKGMLMGSISTYLVHKSPVPVTVIRPQKKKTVRKSKPPPRQATPLSKKVQMGQLAVDELSKTTQPPSASESTTNHG